MQNVKAFVLQQLAFVIACALGFLFLILALALGKVNEPEKGDEIIEYVNLQAFRPTLLEIIGSATSTLNIFTDNVTFPNDLLQALETARSQRRVEINVFASAPKLDFPATYYSLNQSVDMVDGVLSNFVLVDHSALFFAANSLTDTAGVAVLIKNSPRVFADVRTFIEFNKKYSAVGSDKFKSGRWDSTMLVKYNAQFPHDIDNGLSFAQIFSTCVAARDALWPVIPTILKGKKQILVSSNSFIPQNRNSFKTEMFNAISTGSANVSFLFSNATSQDDLNNTMKWVSTLYAMERVDARVTNRRLPTFVIADHDVVVFSHELSRPSFGSPSELVMIVREFRLFPEFHQLFFETWNASTSLEKFRDVLYTM